MLSRYSARTSGQGDAKANFSGAPRYGKRGSASLGLAAEPPVQSPGGLGRILWLWFAFGRPIVQYFAVFVRFSADNCMTLHEIEITW